VIPFRFSCLKILTSHLLGLGLLPGPLAPHAVPPKKTQWRIIWTQEMVPFSASQEAPLAAALAFFNFSSGLSDEPTVQQVRHLFQQLWN
jgi:hypothetical protein